MLLVVVLPRELPITMHTNPTIYHLHLLTRATCLHVCMSWGLGGYLYHMRLSGVKLIKWVATET